MLAFDLRGTQRSKSAVIGLGMIGAAAVRALRAQPALRVVGLGPAESDDWSRHAGPFASHYEHARITCLTNPSLICATLARRLMDAYDEIASASGIIFHYPAGHLRIGDDPGDRLLDGALSIPDIGHLMDLCIHQQTITGDDERQTPVLY